MLHAGQKKIGESYKSEILFGKTLGMVELTRNAMLRPGTNICMDNNDENCQFWSTKMVLVYVLVRYDEVETNDKVAADAVDQKLNWVQLIWWRYEEKNCKEIVGNEYALWSLDSVRGHIHVVCADNLL